MQDLETQVIENQKVLAETKEIDVVAAKHDEKLMRFLVKQITSFGSWLFPRSQALPED
jgi:hypothetical protein